MSSRKHLPNYFLIVLPLIANIFLLAGCGARCTPQNAQDAHKNIHRQGERITESWQIALEGIQEQRIDNLYHYEALARSIGDIRDDIAQLRVPECAQDAKNALLTYSDGYIQTSLLMAQHADPQEVEASIAEVERFQQDYIEEMDALKEFFH